MKTDNIDAAMRPAMRPPHPQRLIDKADEDRNGSLSPAEWQTITDKISIRHSVELDAETLLEQYDEDSDGVLSETEAHNALAGIAEQLGLEPPPPPPDDDQTNGRLAQGIRAYRENAALGQMKESTEK